MGKWATYQRRGGGGIPGSTVPALLPTPVFTVDWEAHGNVLSAEVNSLLDPSLPGVTGLTLNTSLNGGPWTFAGDVPLNGSTSFGPFNLGDTVVVQAAWTDGSDLPLSAYCDSPNINF